MRRREFIKLVGGTAATWPFAARAQQPGKVFRIGFLGVSRDAPGTAANYKAFSDELREKGFSEGQNLVIEYRSSDDPRGVSVAGAELRRAHLDESSPRGRKSRSKRSSIRVDPFRLSCRRSTMTQ
jgi:putative ABC transport system substrate-binding protein